MTAVGIVLVTMGGGVAGLGAGAWARRWYAPVLRCLDGIHPFWLGALQLTGGSALALLGLLTLVDSPQPRESVFRWLVVIATDTLPCLAGGLLEREHRAWADGRRPRMNLARRVLRYLLTRQEPAGGPGGLPR
jgi:hypothetical protein